jgi:hypothetical protein
MSFLFNPGEERTRLKWAVARGNWREVLLAIGREFNNSDGHSRAENSCKLKGLFREANSSFESERMEIESPRGNFSEAPQQLDRFWGTKHFSRKALNVP